MTLRPRHRLTLLTLARAATPPSGRQVFGGFVPFADPTTQTADGWTVLAYEVSMALSGVALSKKDFEDCVSNFGRYPCVPVTIEHADTEVSPFAQPPREWREPNGHIEELRVGSMVRGGRTVATLEGKPSYEPELSGKVGAGKKWRYGSITIIQGAVDEESGADLGSMLWSWSLTAHPRLTGLPPVRVAAGRAPGTPVVAGWWYGEIEDRDDLLAMLRAVLDLPATTTEAEVLAELTKLEALVATPDDTSGIDVECIVGRIRDALRLPALTTTTEVLTEVRKGLDTMPTETTAPTGALMSSRGTTAVTTENTMLKFLELAAKFGLTATSEDDARDKILALLALGADALKGLGLPLAASPADVAAKVKELTTLAARVPTMETELVAFRANEAKTAEALRTAWLDDLVAARPELGTVRASLALHAERDWTGFQASYPRPTREALVTAAAEQAQRAQDPARTQPVAVTAANPATKDAPKAADAPKIDRKAIGDVLAEFGYPSDALSVTQALAQGYTPATLRAALEQRAR